MNARAGSAMDECERYIESRGINVNSINNELREAFRAGWKRGYYDGLAVKAQKGRNVQSKRSR